MTFFILQVAIGLNKGIGWLNIKHKTDIMLISTNSLEHCPNKKETLWYFIYFDKENLAANLSAFFHVLTLQDWVSIPRIFSETINWD